MEVKLKAERRDGAGKGVARKIRAAGKVPGVVYGGGMEPLSVAVDALELWHALHTHAGTNVLIDLNVDGKRFLTMPREVQRDVLRGSLVHVDLLQVRRDVAIEVEVPVHLVGESRGVKEGGVVEHHLWQLRVQCLPTNVPQSIDADVSELAIGDSLHVSDVAAPEGVTILTPPTEIIVSVVPPPVLEVPVPEEVEAVPGEEALEAEAPAPEAEGEAPARGEAEEAEE